MSFASPFPEVEIPSTSVYDFLFGDVDDTHLDRVALVDAKSGRQTSYREMIGRIDAFAGALADRGIGVGDVVGLLSPNSSGFAVAFHGILRAGATATTINALFTAKDVAKQLTDSKARMLVIDGAYVSRRGSRPAAASAAVWSALWGSSAESATKGSPARSRRRGPPFLRAEQRARAQSWNEGGRGRSSSANERQTIVASSGPFSLERWASR